MKTIVYYLFLILALIINVSCESQSEYNTQKQLDLLYENIENGYIDGSKIYGKYENAKIYNDLEFEFFVEKVIYYIKNGMIDELAPLIYYPIAINANGQGKILHINDISDFKENSKIIMSDHRIKLLCKQGTLNLRTIDHFTKVKTNDYRVFAGEFGEITYIRGDEKGMETYKIRTIF